MLCQEKVSENEIYKLLALQQRTRWCGIFWSHDADTNDKEFCLINQIFNVEKLKQISGSLLLHTIDIKQTISQIHINHITILVSN